MQLIYLQLINGFLLIIKYLTFQNATLGSTVIQVEAFDEDIGPNGAVRYRLRQDLSGDWRTFTIDDTTGIIQLRQPLDRERQKTYQVTCALLPCITYILSHTSAYAIVF